MLFHAVLQVVLAHVQCACVLHSICPAQHLSCTSAGA
jgi:hypothetical protein